MAQNTVDASLSATAASNEQHGKMAVKTPSSPFQDHFTSSK